VSDAVSDQEQGNPADDGWDGYYRTVVSREPRDTLLAALAEAGPVEELGRDGSAPLAIDLGCGDGTDTVALLEAGWRVLAIDSSPDFPGYLLPRVRLPEQRDRLELQVADFRTADLPRCDLLHAGFSLFFCPPADFPAVWRRVRAALAPGAVLSVHLLGPEDSWHDWPGVTTHDRAEVADLLSGLHVVTVQEVHEDGWSFAGEKHWHRWHILARNRDPATAVISE